MVLNGIFSNRKQAQRAEREKKESLNHRKPTHLRVNPRNNKRSAISKPTAYHTITASATL